MPSDIHVFVRWKEPSVFAGEEVQCTITFKNVADEIGELGTDAKPRGRKDSINGFHARRLSSGTTLGPIAQVPFSPSRPNQPQGRHRTTASLSITPSSATFPRSPAWSSSDRSDTRPTHQHQRSISVLSWGANERGGHTPNLRAAPPPIKRPAFGHSRSASMQVLSRGHPSSEELSRNGMGVKRTGSSRHSSLNHIDHARAGLGVSTKPTRRAISQRSPSISPTISEGDNRVPNPHAVEFKFPMAGNGRSTPDSNSSRHSTGPTNLKEHGGQPSVNAPQLTAQTLMAGRQISGASIDGSVRSSGEFYPMSNQSSDTLASEHISAAPQRPLISVHSRMPSRFNSTTRANQPETLLMGYAQLNASFTVDGSLVDQSPFEEVKRKGFMGGQGGGGVVGIEKRKSQGGFLGGFNLTSLSESLSGLLGPQEMTSTKEMKGVVSSRSIPLLSTPQSLLFVDMELKPGQERSFSYSFKLPKGLPASHKGKAIKINYNLVIGTQFAASDRDFQKVRSVTVPLRVFSGVNSDGDILGHDLMHPYVILQDTAKTEMLDAIAKVKTASPKVQGHEAFASDFVAYTQNLLSKRFRRSSSGATTLDDFSAFPGRDAAISSNLSKELIRRAIFRSNQAVESDRSPNRFEISRNGYFVGVVVLNRPYHRIGETISASIDFSGSQISTLSLRCTLESCEKVDPSLALRSPASINRATKKVYASQSENTVFSKKAVFSPSIPVSATPTLFTSGINICWQLRFEFATAKPLVDLEDLPESQPLGVELMEEIASDERGISKAALEAIPCDSFEVIIPVTIYGDVIKETEEEEVIGLPI